ncbi:deoxynucleotide monophosphate kinase family protein [Methylomonas sp. 11b]|uniref:deoxynucleotide monophosphate kinase family protein n=1 Tax=Methylomonas sp. 11b TaxID=1168169 RepID=UPI00047949C5|nr:hypothetical protein [Methylomonas sp. 11b]
MIIGLAGKKRSGKSSAAETLEHIGFDVLSFAYTLKLMARILMRDCGMNEEQIKAAQQDKEAVIAVLGVSYRSLCQTLGTEWGRQCVHGDLWVIAARHRVLMSMEDHQVFEDVRFENEATMIRSLGGQIIHVSRPGLVLQDDHASEAGIAFVPGDIELVNDGDLDSWFDKVASVGHRLTK